MLCTRAKVILDLDKNTSRKARESVLYHLYETNNTNSLIPVRHKTKRNRTIDRLESKIGQCKSSYTLHRPG